MYDWRQSAAYIIKQYRNVGGDAFVFGKPERMFYEYIFEKYPEIKDKRIVCVGDTLTTDILGASRIGLDSVLITGGESASKQYTSRSIMNGVSCRPTYSLLYFRY